MSNKLTSRSDIVLDALSVYRLVRLAQQDTVPPVLEIREAILNRWGDKRWAELAECPHCLSVWVAAAVVVLRLRYPRAWAPLARLLGLAAVTSLIAEWQANQQ